MRRDCAGFYVIVRDSEHILKSSQCSGNGIPRGEPCFPFCTSELPVEPIEH